MTGPKFKTLQGAAHAVGLAPDDLRARLDAAPSIVVDGYQLARRGADLVEVRDVRTTAERE